MLFLALKQMIIKTTSGIRPRQKEITGSIMNAASKAPTTSMKIVAGPNIEEANRNPWYIIYTIEMFSFFLAVCRAFLE